MTGAFLKSNSGVLNIFCNGEVHSVAPDHANYQQIIDKLTKGEYSGIESLLNTAKAITEYSFGKIVVRNGQVFYGEHEVRNTLVDRIIFAMNAGEDYERFIKFLDKLLDNPSNNAVNQLYDFLKHYDLKISADGDFYAYKAISGTWKDKWTGKIDNSVDAKPSMPRSMVCEDPHMCAGPGLHCGSILYASTYGSQNYDKMVVVKVNPANVVSIPRDSDYQKCRTSGYEVVSESNWSGEPINGTFTFEAVGASTILKPEDKPCEVAEKAPERVYDETPSKPYIPDSCEDRDEDENEKPVCGDCDCGDECEGGGDDEDDEEEFCDGCGAYVEDCTCDDEDEEEDCDDDDDDEGCDEGNYCCECGVEIPEDKAVCSGCADEDEDEEGDDTNICDDCGCPIDDDEDLCDPCNDKIVSEQEDAKEAECVHKPLGDNAAKVAKWWNPMTW